ncbi:hypothetical protein Syun_019223 [Stephania yunnanensis]|uniref:Uncharacterized protein n=1 Tax=Stephania yunnanensis TaxID=152371 RepID=A0AAP0IW35_9MAGN
MCLPPASQALSPQDPLAHRPPLHQQSARRCTCSPPAARHNPPDLASPYLTVPPAVPPAPPIAPFAPPAAPASSDLPPVTSPHHHRSSSLPALPRHPQLPQLPLQQHMFSNSRERNRERENGRFDETRRRRSTGARPRHVRLLVSRHTRKFGHTRSAADDAGHQIRRCIFFFKQINQIITNEQPHSNKTKRNQESWR